MAYLYEIYSKVIENYQEEKEVTFIVSSDRKLTAQEVELKLIRGDYEEKIIGKTLSQRASEEISEINSIVEINPYTIRKIKEL